MTVVSYNWIAPSFKAGGPTQSLNNLNRILGDLSFVADSREYDDSKLEVPANRWVRQLSGNKIWYSNQSQFDWITFVKSLSADCWYINGFSSFRFVLIPLIFGRSKLKVICPRGMLDQGSLNQKAFKKKLYLLFWKWAGLHKQITFHAASELEALGIRNVFGEEIKLKVVPNVPHILDLKPMPQKDKGSLRLITVAVVGPMKNILNVLKALDRVKERVSYEIYGTIKDVAYWKSCQNIIDDLPSNINVMYHGVIIPDQVASALESAHVFIQPSKSENFGHSLYEAFSSGRPVITSNSTPWNRLENAKAGLNIDGNDIEELTRGISFFAQMDQTQINEWGISARDYAEKAIDLDKLKDSYLDLFGIKNIEA